MQDEKNRRINKTFFAKKWLDVIERALLDRTIKENTLAWIRTDLPEDPMLTYSIVFPRGYCLALRFGGYLLEPNDRVTVVTELGFVTTFQIGVNAAPKHFTDIIRSFVLATSNDWRTEYICVERIGRIVKNQLSKDPHYFLTGIVAATVYEDYYEHIDAKLIFKKSIVPLQIKSSERQAELHKKNTPHIPVLLYQPKMTDEELLLHVLRICVAYDKCKERV